MERCVCLHSDFGFEVDDTDEPATACAAAGALWLARHRRGAQNALRRACRRRAWTKDMACRVQQMCEALKKLHYSFCHR